MKRIQGWDSIQQDMEDNFGAMLDNYISMVPEARNWYRPQVDFIFIRN